MEILLALFGSALLVLLGPWLLLRLLSPAQTGTMPVFAVIPAACLLYTSPEVSLVAILDADKEGFLRSETSLIQTIGRAARNAEGLVILYADTVTPSMAAAMEETQRRREIQDAYNQAHGIVPKTIVKSVRDLIEISHAPDGKGKKGQGAKALTQKEKANLIANLEKEMKEASRRLEFEYAAILRDQIIELRGKETTD